MGSSFNATKAALKLRRALRETKTADGRTHGEICDDYFASNPKPLVAPKVSWAESVIEANSLTIEAFFQWEVVWLQEPGSTLRGREPYLVLDELKRREAVKNRITKLPSDLREVQDEALELFTKKNNDYGDSFTEHGHIGVLIRIHDKLKRITSITKNGIEVNDESLRDTLIDLHNYSAMAVILMDEEQTDGK